MTESVNTNPVPVSTIGDIIVYSIMLVKHNIHDMLKNDDNHRGKCPNYKHFRLVVYYFAKTVISHVRAWTECAKCLPGIHYTKLIHSVFLLFYLK